MKDLSTARAVLFSACLAVSGHSAILAFYEFPRSIEGGILYLLPFTTGLIGAFIMLLPRLADLAKEREMRRKRALLMCKQVLEEEGVIPRIEVLPHEIPQWMREAGIPPCDVKPKVVR